MVTFWVLSACFISEHWSESTLVNCFYECLLCVIPEYLRQKSQSMSDVAFVSGEQFYSLLSLLSNTGTHTNYMHQQSQAPASVYSTQRLGLWLLMHANWCVCVFSSLCSPTLIPSYAQEPISVMSKQVKVDSSSWFAEESLTPALFPHAWGIKRLKNSCLFAFIFRFGKPLALLTMQRAWHWKLKTDWTLHDKSLVSFKFKA